MPLPNEIFCLPPTPSRATAGQTLDPAGERQAGVPVAPTATLATSRDLAGKQGEARTGEGPSLSMKCDAPTKQKNSPPTGQKTGHGPICSTNSYSEVPLRASGDTPVAEVFLECGDELTRRPCASRDTPRSLARLHATYNQTPQIPRARADTTCNTRRGPQQHRRPSHQRHSIRQPANRRQDDGYHGYTPGADVAPTGWREQPSAQGQPALLPLAPSTPQPKRNATKPSRSPRGQRSGSVAPGRTTQVLGTSKSSAGAMRPKNSCDQSLENEPVQGAQTRLL